ncbi:hypothetical protein ON010_g8702 [Phytophthora cinnamomi]|nr:hypothetical protein ON010_g8702 [Phytophthora cinnamomi]
MEGIFITDTGGSLRASKQTPALFNVRLHRFRIYPASGGSNMPTRPPPPPPPPNEDDVLISAVLMDYLTVTRCGTGDVPGVAKDIPSTLATSLANCGDTPDTSQCTIGHAKRQQLTEGAVPTPVGVSSLA